MSEQAQKVADFDSVDESKFCYFKHKGAWYLNLPDCGLANLANHAIEEHEDGTISATPSILVKGHKDNGEPVERHGYLTKGVWSEC